MESILKTSKPNSKFIGSKLFGCELVDKLTKEEWAAIAYYLSQRLGYDGCEKNAVIEEFNALCENGIILKNPIRQ